MMSGNGCKTKKVCYVTEEVTQEVTRDTAVETAGRMLKSGKFTAEEIHEYYPLAVYRRDPGTESRMIGKNEYLKWAVRYRQPIFIKKFCQEKTLDTRAFFV